MIGLLFQSFHYNLQLSLFVPVLYSSIHLLLSLQTFCAYRFPHAATLGAYRCFLKRICYSLLSCSPALLLSWYPYPRALVKIVSLTTSSMPYMFSSPRILLSTLPYACLSVPPYLFLSMRSLQLCIIFPPYFLSMTHGFPTYLDRILTLVRLSLAFCDLAYLQDPLVSFFFKSLSTFFRLFPSPR